MTVSIPLLSGVGALIDAYDAVIIDLWGVVHDGVKLYPGVADCLEKIAETGKPYAMLTNAPRRADAIALSMADMGLPPALYPIIMSSGEAAWLGLRERHEAFFDGVGDRCLHIGPERDRNLFDGQTLEIVDEIADADLIVNTGPWEDDETVADYAPTLDRGAERDIPMICANPDLEVIRGGKRIICAGALAQYYEEKGGRVLCYGKPYPPIYETCLRMIGDPAPDRVLAIGDSLRTDIAGAAAMGMDSVLVVGGIHGEEFAINGPAAEAEARIAAKCQEQGLAPIAAVANLAW
jgi:HAD superfamily hydrolase (TIGR01459 family)